MTLYQRLDCWLWTMLWGSHLLKDERVIKVKGWRTALVQRHGSRMTVTPMLWWIDY